MNDSLAGHSPVLFARQPLYLRREYSANSLTADVSRLLDPAFASCHNSSGRPVTNPAQARAYVDYSGQLHDPDFRDFPVSSSSDRSPKPVRLGRRHTVSTCGGASSDPREDSFPSQDYVRSRSMQNPTHGERGKDVMYKTNSPSSPGSSTPSPRCHLQRTISLSSTSSCSSPHSYIYHELNPWPSSPCDLEGLREEEDEFLVPNEDLLRPADYREKGKGTNGSFLRRRMWQNPSSPPSVPATAPDLLPGDGEEEGGKPRRTRSGSLLRRLRSASQSSSVQVPPSIKITIPEFELPKKQDCCTVQVYPVTDEDSDFIAAYEPEQPLAMSPDYYSAATGRRDSTLLAQLRAADLQWRTRMYRVKSRISTSQRNVSTWMDEKFGNMARNTQ